MNNLDKELPTSRPDYIFIAMTLMTMRESIKFHLSGDFDFQKKNGEKSFGEKEEEAVLFIPDAKDELEPRLIGMINKKRGGFKDDEADDTEDPRDAPLPVVPPMAPKPVAVAAYPIRYSGQMAIKKPSNQYEMRPLNFASIPPPPANLIFNGNKILQGPSTPMNSANPTVVPKPVDPLQAEKNQVQREKMELQIKLDAAKMGQSKEELEKMRREKEELAAKLAALEAGKEDQDRLDRERQAKAELEQKLKAMEAEQEQARLEQERKDKEKLVAKLDELKNNNAKEALEKERREKAELEAKIAELEAQKKRNAEAEAAKASSTPSTSPQPSPSPVNAIGEKLAVQSTYADGR
ncbi:hypothetical protein M3Y95_00976500 [Aphelenchoides besseyi]|nr:hypothetical protein M3Y95_00976500 [Aphelenchoides besseyi]